MWFGVPMVQREPKNYHNDCYFCMVVCLDGISKRRKIGIILILSLARQPIPQCTEVPVPVFTFLPDLTADKMLLEAMDDTNSSDSSISSSSNMAAAASSLSAKPNLLVKAN